MKIKNILSMTVTAMVLSINAAAYAEVQIKDPWVRSTIPQQTVTGVFFQITSTENAKLIKVEAKGVATAEIHEMKIVGDVMKMREVGTLPLPAGKTVELKPGSYHVMLTGLKKAIKVGEELPLTLTVEGAKKKLQTIEIKAKARALDEH